MEPITRKEKFLAKGGGQEVSLPEPITWEEMYLAKLAGQDVAIPEPYTRREMLLKAACENAGGGGGGGTGGGGAEIKTCAVRFVDGGDGESSGVYYYTKCVDGVLSTEKVGDPYNSSWQSGFDITLENVVCGSLIWFLWSYQGDYGDIGIEGSETAAYLANGIQAPNETALFVAPIEPNAVCTISLSGGTDNFGPPDW